MFKLGINVMNVLIFVIKSKKDTERGNEHCNIFYYLMSWKNIFRTFSTLMPVFLPVENTNPLFLRHIMLLLKLHSTFSVWEALTLANVSRLGILMTASHEMAP